MSMLIVKVDLSCPRCNKKIKKILEQHKDRWDIETIEYDEEEGAVKLCGPFDPEKLAKRLCRKACKIIDDIFVPKPSPPESPKKSPPESPEKSPPESPEKSPPESPKKSPPESPKKSPPESPKNSPPESPEKSPPGSPCWYPYPCPYPYPYPYPCPYPSPYPFPCECPPYWGICPENNKPQGWCTCGCGSSAGCDGGYWPPPPHPPGGRPMCWLVCEEEGGYCSIM